LDIDIGVGVTFSIGMIAAALLYGSRRP